METRFAKADDLEDVMRLWGVCFHDTPAYMQMYFGHLYRAENTLLYQEEGRLAAMLQILPYDLWVDGGMIRGGYIAGVCTDPAFRNRGLMRALIEEAHLTMQARGMAFSALVPAVQNFYEKFGYRFAFYQEEKSYTAADFLDVPAKGSACDLSHLKRAYARQKMSFSLLPVRSDTWWQCIHLLYLAPENCGAMGFGEGYAVYEAKGDVLHIRESFYDIPADFRAMVAGILLRHPAIKTIKYTAGGEKKPFGMIKWLQENAPAARLTGYMNLMLD